MPNSFSTYNGSTGFITVPDDDALDLGTGDFTICGWAKGTFNVFDSDQIVGNFYEALSGSEGWRVYVYQGEINLILTKDARTIVCSSNVHADDSWVAFAIACDRDGNAIFYINGSIEKTTDISSMVSDDVCDYRTSIIMGKRNKIIGTAFFSGSLDDLRIYKKACTQAEIIKIVKSRGVYNEADVSIPAAVVFNFNDNFVANEIFSEIPASPSQLVGTRSGAGVTIEAGELPDVLSGGSSMEDILEEMWSF